MLVIGLIVFGIILHRIADWLLQNDWMATNKTNLKHPSGYVHAGIYTICMAIIFPLGVAIIIGITHLLIDTRIPTQWWCKITRKTNLPFVLLEVDQTFHIVIIAIAALLCGK